MDFLAPEDRAPARLPRREVLGTDLAQPTATLRSEVGGAGERADNVEHPHLVEEGLRGTLSVAVLGPRGDTKPLEFRLSVLRVRGREPGRQRLAVLPPENADVDVGARDLVQ